MIYAYRKAIPADIPECVIVRGKTRENAFSVERLKAIGVTVESWTKQVLDESLVGNVCLCDEKIVGYCFGSMITGEIVVLALLPEHESCGIGKRMLGTIVDELVNTGFNRLFLGCTKDSGARSYGFYRHLGWKSTGRVDTNDDEILEFIIK